MVGFWSILVFAVLGVCGWIYFQNENSKGGEKQGKEKLEKSKKKSEVKKKTKQSLERKQEEKKQGKKNNLEKEPIQKSNPIQKQNHELISTEKKEPSSQFRVVELRTKPTEIKDSKPESNPKRIEVGWSQVEVKKKKPNEPKREFQSASFGVNSSPNSEKDITKKQRENLRKGEKLKLMKSVEAQLQAERLLNHRRSQLRIHQENRTNHAEKIQPIPQVKNIWG
eukprot:Sdes_comp20257_c0_seq1m13724